MAETCHSLCSSPALPYATLSSITFRAGSSNLRHVLLHFDLLSQPPRDWALRGCVRVGMWQPVAEQPRYNAEGAQDGELHEQRRLGDIPELR